MNARVVMIVLKMQHVLTQMEATNVPAKVAIQAMENNVVSQYLYVIL